MIVWLKPSVFVVLLAPGLWLAYAVAAEATTPGSRLGADPIAAVVDFLGVWSLRVLLLALAVSPLRRLTGWSALARIRRMVGLFAFTYITLHLLGFAGLIVGWDWQALLIELVERPYVTLGFTAFVLLIPLAITSTTAWQRRLRRRWQILHKAVFPAAVLALLHLAWLTKDGYAELAVYSVLFVLLLGERLWRRRQPSR